MTIKIYLTPNIEKLIRIVSKAASFEFVSFAMGDYV